MTPRALSAVWAVALLAPALSALANQDLVQDSTAQAHALSRQPQKPSATTADAGPSIGAMAERSQIEIDPKAVSWAERHVANIDLVPLANRVPIYYIVSLFLDRLDHWRRFKPFYDAVFADPAFARRYPPFVDPDEGLYVAILPPGTRLTDLKPYQKLKGKTVEDVYGYAGDKRSMDDIQGDGSRQSLVVPLGLLTPKPTGTYNTFYHEFGHMIHLSLMTPEEYRQVEPLYRNALAKGRCLDDYAATTSSEYFAQGLEAYLSVTKDTAYKYRKSTRKDLRDKDPDLFRFIDALVRGRS